MKKKKFILYLKIINLVITDFALIVFIVMIAYLLLRSLFGSIFKNAGLSIALTFAVIFTILLLCSNYSSIYKKANDEVMRLYSESYDELQKGTALLDTKSSEFYLVKQINGDNIVLIDCDGNIKTIQEYEYKNHFIAMVKNS